MASTAIATNRAVDRASAWPELLGMAPLGLLPMKQHLNAIAAGLQATG